jgi:Protein of unknown function (DUF3501)
MRTIERNEILALGDYEQIRPHFRARIIEEKRPRRVALGEHLAVTFQNRDTVLLQIQEMLRTERITSEPAIAHEISTYNDLIPGEDELSVTLWVQIPDKPLRDRLLVELAGLEDTVRLDVDGQSFEVKGPRPDGFMEGRTTAVHYLKAKLSPEAAAAIKARTAKVAITIEHPQHLARVELDRATLAKLAEDLAT